MEFNMYKFIKFSEEIDKICEKYGVIASIMEENIGLKIDCTNLVEVKVDDYD